MGLGRYDDDNLQRAQMLADAGLGSRPLKLEHGGPMQNATRAGDRSAGRNLITTLQDVVELIFRDAEVRSAPDGASIAKQDRLRRFVSDAQPRRGLVRNVAMALDGDELVGCRAACPFNVRAQLIQRLAADSAVAAVFEQKNRPFAGFGDSGFELFNV